MRKKYSLRLVFRIVVLAIVLFLYAVDSDSFLVIEPEGFFYRPSILHLLWLLWVGDMFLKLFPNRGLITIGAMKQLRSYYEEATPYASKEQLKSYHKTNGHRAFLILLIWIGIGIVSSFLHHIKLVENRELFLISVFFYVCDLICVVIWCPFRVFILKNRCCTTCRIFNWDHIMMTMPMISIGSFYSNSLIIGSLFMFFLWEYRIRKSPELFYEGTNEALKCKNCKELLCGRRKHRYN